MRAAKRTPLPARTEYEMAAEVLAVLIDRGLIGNTPGRILKAAEVVGIPTSAVRLAWVKCTERGYRAPRLSAPDESRPDLRLLPEPEPRIATSRSNHGAITKNVGRRA